MKFGLSNNNLVNLQSVIAQIPSIEQVLIFGSRARGDYRYNSDIDIALIGEHVSHSDQLKLMHLIDDLMMPYMVDVLRIASIRNERLIHLIHKEGKVLYQKSELVKE